MTIFTRLSKDALTLVLAVVVAAFVCSTLAAFSETLFMPLLALALMVPVVGSYAVALKHDFDAIDFSASA